MKKGIHPEYKETTIVCSCGNVIKTRSTKKNIRIEICSNCHPFFTGEQKFVDTAGRVERFKRKYQQWGKAMPVQKETTAKTKVVPPVAATETETEGEIAVEKKG